MATAANDIFSCNLFKSHLDIIMYMYIAVCRQATALKTCGCFYGFNQYDFTFQWLQTTKGKAEAMALCVLPMKRTRFLPSEIWIITWG